MGVRHLRDLDVGALHHLAGGVLGGGDGLQVVGFVWLAIAVLGEEQRAIGGGIG